MPLPTHLEEILADLGPLIREGEVRSIFRGGVLAADPFMRDGQWVHGCELHSSDDPASSDDDTIFCDPSTYRLLLDEAVRRASAALVVGNGTPREPPVAQPEGAVDEPAPGPVTSWEGVARVAGVSVDTVFRRRKERGEIKKKPWFPSSEAAAEWFKGRERGGPATGSPPRSKRSRSPKPQGGTTLADLKADWGRKK